jgi:hypothetical protein
MSLSQATRNRPPVAPASVFAPDGRRRLWHFTYPCRICGAYNFGRSRTLDDVTGLRRATCGHVVTVMAARTYTGRPADRTA